jgi:uncharacterized protein YndB with AHSA1/START domain
MRTKARTEITVQVAVAVPINQGWKCWTSPEDIICWNFASDDWHTPRAENDLRVGGKFLSRMEAKDGSMGFDFEGIYQIVKPHEQIQYILADDRIVKIDFQEDGANTLIIETFDAEEENSIELQRGGWQSILDNFKGYAEGKAML